MKFRTALLTATTVAASVMLSHVASAQPVTGVYVAGGIGYNNESSQRAKDIYQNGVGQPDTNRISVLNGYTGLASVGYGFGNGFRVELEGDYYRNNFHKTSMGGRLEGAGGREKKYGAFVNVLYDFNLGLPIYPYVGAGIGLQDDNFNAYNSQGIYVSKTKGALAYQGIVGLAVPITAAPGLSATLEYRFTALAGSRKFNGADTNGTPATFKVGNEYNNTVLIGLRYQLFQPAAQPVPAPTPAPAPVAAAPAPAPARTYLVFFDWNQSSLTPRATQIIAQAASDSHTAQTTTLDVSGYTDTSGTASYNMGLSKRRAQAVAAQLVTDGVPQSEIAIHAYGETHLLVPTGPGVREPQNRRVEIVLQ